MIHRSARASELLPELKENRYTFRLLNLELTIRASLDNPAVTGMFVAKSTSPSVDSKRAEGLLEAALRIERLSDFEAPGRPARPETGRD
jgi:hypothetical protein